MVAGAPEPGCAAAGGGRRALVDTARSRGVDHAYGPLASTERVAMRTRLLLLAVAAAFAVSIGPAAGAQAPAGDSVVGQLGDRDYLGAPASFLIEVRSGPSGERPTGMAEADYGVYPSFWAARVDTGGAVTCLSVTGDTAVVGFSGFDIDNGRTAPRPTAGLVRVVDRGGPGTALDRVEWQRVAGPIFGPPIPGPTDCSSYAPRFPIVQGPLANDTGDIVVTDAQPLPTSKDQCKHDGWKTFGVFKNQGACVSFVASGGKNPPTN
jgi:hypothetical protein